jgi:hypothetical protein
MWRFTMALSACLWACGDNTAVPPDGRADVKPFEPAPHIPMPRVFPHAGTVLESARLVTLTFDGYAARASVEAFGDMVVGSHWYVSAGAEYNVKAGSQIQKVSLGPAPASLTREDIRDRIASLADRGLITLPASPDAPEDGLVYLLYVPPGVAYSDPPGTPSARSYHEVLKLSTGSKVPLAVVIDDGKGDLRTTTVAAAHQLINTATDPYEVPRDGYYADPPMTDPWSLVLGEVADLCDGEQPITESGFAMPRVYSDSAVAAGKSPCMPFVPDDSWNDVSAKPQQMPDIEPGGSVTYTLTGWSTREIPDWQLSTHVVDRSDFTLAEMDPQLSDTTINNKSTVTLTLHVPEDARPGDTGGVFVLSGENVRPWAVGFLVQ